MLDYRMITFLKLCEKMNYRLTAEELHMTQPAVTQHIHYLEEEYNCKLFNYDKKKLEKTESCLILEEYAKSAYYNHIKIKEIINSEKKIKIRMGVTKTIGEFVINEKIRKMFENINYDFSLVIDNTKKLLELLEKNQLDFVLVEGIFDKNKYEYELYKKDEFIGICSKKHRFFNKEVKIEELFDENIIIREKGSGTRAILEQILENKNFSLNSFKKQISISNFSLIGEFVQENLGISFVYESFTKKYKDIGRFFLKEKIEREYNYVTLKNTFAKNYIEIFKNI
ncbi:MULTISPECIES: LysR family transcriptional regulator [Fusobacterium]|nr:MULTISPECIES: LysR family transcriptional regulator [Fusobacterium]MDY3237308.1 LysR family transcriptional regulator [Fusobacterium perfoetens]NME35748.1 LysR family transcriptional regulator [Fusobacterium sp. FSA-380-WT-3A]